MRTLVLASQKGGVGKTTLAGHLGVVAEQSGAGPVALIDCDPQGSLASWWNERTAEAPLFASVAIANLANHLQALDRAGIKLAIATLAKSGASAVRSFHQDASDPCGSQSIRATGPAPLCSATTPMCPARVVLPTPPF